MTGRERRWKSVFSTTEQIITTTAATTYNLTDVSQIWKKILITHTHNYGSLTIEQWLIN